MKTCFIQKLKRYKRCFRTTIPDASIVAGIWVDGADAIDSAADRRRLRKSGLDGAGSGRVVASRESNKAWLVVVDVSDGDVDDECARADWVTGVSRHHQQPEVIHRLTVHLHVQ